MDLQEFERRLREIRQTQGGAGRRFLEGPPAEGADAESFLRNMPDIADVPRNLWGEIIGPERPLGELGQAPPRPGRRAIDIVGPQGLADMVLPHIQGLVGGRLADLITSYISGADIEELRAVADAGEGVLEQAIQGPAVPGENQLVARTRELLAGANHAEIQRFSDSVRTIARNIVAAQVERQTGIPRQATGALFDLLTGYLRRHTSEIGPTLINIAGMIAGGYRTPGRLAVLTAGLGIAGYGASRYYINEAEEAIRDIEQEVSQGLLLSEDEENILNNMKLYLQDVNTLGNYAAQQGQLSNINNLLVGSLQKLQTSQTIEQEKINLQSINKLMYVKHYELALYDRQLRARTAPNPNPPQLKPNVWGSRPIRITPDWRGAIW